MVEKRIRILLVDDAFYPEMDGVFNVLINTAKILKKNHDVALLVPLIDKNNVYKNLENLNIIYCKCMRAIENYKLPIPLFDKSIKKKIDEFKPDIIHLHSPASLAKYAIKYAKKHNIPTISTLHTRFDINLYYLLGRYNPFCKVFINYISKVLNSSFALAVLSESAKKYTIKEYKIRRDMPIYILPNATDFEPESISETCLNDLKDKYQIKDGDNLFITVTRMYKYKNLFFICDSLKILKEEGVDFKMFFVGDGKDLKSLIKYTKKLGIYNNCIFTGFIRNKKELACFFKICDCVLLPSVYDNSSLVKFESAAYKKPFFCLKNTLVADGIIDLENGYLSNEDVNEFSSKIKYIIENKKENSLIGENAYKTIYKHWDEMEEQIISTYFDVIKKYNS